MSRFETSRLPSEPTDTAPDGSDVRALLSTSQGSMAHFTFPPGRVSPAVRHRRVEEIWYIIEGEGKLWRSTGEATEISDLAAGCCLTIPVGTSFQVRNDGRSPLVALGVTMPPWPPEGDADIVDGHWEPGGLPL